MHPNQTELVAYLVLFILVGVLFLFVSLLIGWFIRPHAPSVSKGDIYECGEPAVGSGFIQFDLRFYVVALLFIIFEVELAFFFPPAVVFGKINQLLNPNFGPKLTASSKADPASGKSNLTPAAQKKFAELGIPAAFPQPSKSTTGNEIRENSWNTLSNEQKSQAFDDSLRSLSLMAMLDLGVFFVVLLVGFAFLWKQGDLDWVRAVTRRPATSDINQAVSQSYGEGR